MDNLYDILEISKKASKEVIEKAYKTLAKKYHPDLQEGEESKKFAEEKMKEINEAYEVLINDDKREKYNKKIENEESQNIGNNTYSKQNTCNDYKQNNSNTKDNATNSQVRYQRNNQSEINLKKERLLRQKKFEEEIIREKRRAYNEAYNQYLRSMGFKTREKWTLKKLLTLIITVLVLIAIAYILWLIPSIKNKLIETYQQNSILKAIVDVFISLIKSIFNIFKK